MKDRKKNNLLHLVKINVISYNENAYEDEENLDIDEKYIINKIIYSNCYSSYQVIHFLNMGYILRRVNHSVRF